MCEAVKLTALHLIPLCYVIEVPILTALGREHQTHLSPNSQQPISTKLKSIIV